MTTFHRFEEIEGWQKAREMTQVVYSVSKFNQVNDLAIETAKKVGGLIRYLQKTNIRGTKYK